MSLKRTTNILLTAIIVVNGFTMLSPAWPMVRFWWVRHFTHQQQALAVYTQPSAPTSTGTHKVVNPVPSDNRLIIPKIALNDHLYEGTDAYTTLRKGVWHWNQGSSPDKGGNTILLGHRWGYYPDPTGVFYHLDLLKKGDKIAVYWQGKRYLYQVAFTEVVKPTDTHLVQPTTKPTLTLYTCTSLLTGINRLFVVSNLIEGPSS